MILDQKNFENEVLYNSLVNLGNLYALDVQFDFFDYQLFEVSNSHWHRYNPRKTNNNRFGLSLTSLSGGMSGDPDLDSLAEYNSIYRTNLQEDSFRTPTEALLNTKFLYEPLKDFIPHLGRSHLIQLRAGGYFPFHRDSQDFGATTFRLISLLTNCHPSSFCLIYDQQKIQLEQKFLYFMNTKVEHALFSFHDEATILVLNVILSPESVSLVKQKLMSR